jgi:ABC-2 type transport system ATP-binding protein
MRTLLKSLAAEGRTVLLSSHLMTEMAVTAEHLIIIGRGRLLADTTLGDLIARVGVGSVLVRSPDCGRLRDALVAGRATVTSAEPGMLRVAGLPAERIGDLALRHGIAVHELTPQHASLEQAYMELTRDALEYR